MTVVTLEALETALGGPVAVSAGTVTAQYWAGSQPVTEIDGERVIFPREMRSEIVDGRPTTVLDLIPTRGVRCVRWDIKTARGTWTKIYTEIPDVDTIGIGDLVQVDPKTFEPTGEVVAAWEAVVAVVQADRERAEEAAGEAVASAAAAGASAVSAEGDASSAAGSATTAVAARDEAVTAAGTASTAAGGAESARQAAVTAQGVAESAQAAASTSETAAVSARAAAESAQAGAEAAETSASASATSAENAAALATTARTGAEAARDTAQATADGIPAAVAVAIAAQAGKIIQGTGMPNGVVTATPGTLYVDTASTNGASIWRKSSGSGNTGWVVAIGAVSRNIGASLLLNGWAFSTVQSLLLSRDGDIVTLSIASLGLTGAAATANIFMALPLGFRSDLAGNYGALGPIASGAGDGLSWVRKDFNNLACAARTSVTGVVQWRTNDPWPSTLPGIPA